MTQYLSDGSARRRSRRIDHRNAALRIFKTMIQMVGGESGGRINQYSICGLDLSLVRTGIAIVSPPGVFCYSVGYQVEAPSEKEQLIRIIKIASSIIDYCKKHSVTHVAVEDYAFSANSQAVTKLAELQGVVKTQILAGLKILPSRIASKQARKFLTGKGNAKKPDIQNHLLAIGYLQARNFDESDALAIALVMEAWVKGKKDGLTEYQLKVLKEIGEKRWK